MPDSVSSATAPTIADGSRPSRCQIPRWGKAHIDHPCEQYGTDLPNHPKPKNIKKCKLEETMDFGPGKTFPHNVFLDIQLILYTGKIQNDMSSMLDNVAIPWEEVPKAWSQPSSLWYSPLTLFFTGFLGTAAKVIMRRICRNKRNTQANKQKRLRGVTAGDANTTPPEVLKEGLAEEQEANHSEHQLVEEDRPDEQDRPDGEDRPIEEDRLIEEDQPDGEDQPNHPPVDKQLLNDASKDNEDEEGAEIKRMAGKRRCCIEDSNSEEDNQHAHPLGSQTPSALCASSAIPTSTYTSSSFTSLPGVDQGNKSQSSLSSKRAKATAGNPPTAPKSVASTKPSARPPKGPTPASKPATSKPTAASKGTKPALTQAAAAARPQGHKRKENTKPEPEPKPEYGPKSEPKQGQEFEPESELDEAEQDIPPQNNKRPIPKERYAHLTCQEEVAGLATAGTTTKKKIKTASWSSKSAPNVAGPSTSVVSASSVAAAVASVSSVTASATSKPCRRPIPRLPPQNTQVAGSLAAKSELIDIFNMSQANNNQRNTQSRTKK
ncbi:hypothetical protein RHS01_03644 [Rhizoctonia solani]|uniref:Uncharacterized protein n=1 Tax=Rhizoctonia solani TaxID=456999 RepID=A0A8H7M3R2_9AGAM|nr:hypothetical protein RHS01_03644 [Rhizoctonia solani]